MRYFHSEPQIVEGVLNSLTDSDIQSMAFADSVDTLPAVETIRNHIVSYAKLEDPRNPHVVADPHSAYSPYAVARRISQEVHRLAKAKYEHKQRQMELERAPKAPES